MVVYILFTRHGEGDVSLLSVNRKSQYQALFDRLSEIAERPDAQVPPGSDRVAIQTYCNRTGQVWYAERHDCE